MTNLAAAASRLGQEGAPVFTHLYELLQHRATTSPDTVAIGGQQGLTWKTLTGRELLDLTDRLAVELAECGVGAGDRVVLWLPNAWRTPVYLFALWKLGAVAVPFDREMNPEAASDIIAAVDARLVLVGSGERPSWAREHPVTEWWEPGLRGGEGETGRGGEWEIGRAGATVSGRTATPLPPHPLTPSPPLNSGELAVISYTSGTTGRPKGCMLTHANLCFQAEALQATIPLDADCRLASILPLSHVFELACGLIYPLASGAAVHYIPSRRPPDILRVLREQRITHMLVVPQLLALMGGSLDRQLRDRLPAVVYRALMAAAPRLPLPARRRLFWPVHRQLGGHLRLLASGGAPLPTETQALWERLGVRAVQGYGASETTAVIAGAKADGSTPAGSAGQVLPGVTVRLTPEGEVLVQGPNVMAGYWHDPERTAEVLRDGWLHTGDLATIDGQGNLSIIGRAKDLIVLPSGLKVWPQDVEEVLRTEPAVRDAAIMGVPTATGGLKLHAYLLPASPAQSAADLGALVARCNGRLAQHQRITTASWWAEDDFLRTAMGKVRRHLLPPPSATQTVAVESVLADDDPVGQAIAGLARVPAVLPGQTLGDLGLDSLGLVELALALEEKTGKAIGDGDLRLDLTVEQVRASLVAAPEREADATGTRRARSPWAAPPIWPYTWGRRLRFLSFPVDLLYRYAVTRTVVTGQEHLDGLSPRVIFAGTHHAFADMPLVRYALARSRARHLARWLVIATVSTGIFHHRFYGPWAQLAFGLYPLSQASERDASLRGLVEVATRGNVILIFPQGVHASPEQERRGDPAVRFRPGVAYLAEALGAPVVPFGLAGTERLVPPSLENYRGRRIFGIPLVLRRGPLAIAFGPPLPLRSGELPDEFAARLQADCYALTRQAEAALGHPSVAQPAIS